MPTCTYCKRNYSAHKGLVVFTLEGRTIYYCSSKCRKNMGMKRDPKKINWIRKKIRTGSVENVV
ncbi:MAG: 50S ribosomal protein L24e [Nanoarchaeota archaeon]